MQLPVRRVGPAGHVIMMRAQKRLRRVDGLGGQLDAVEHKMW